MDILKIYIIEDDISRSDRMQRFFEKLDENLKQAEQTEEILEYLRARKISGIMVEHICPANLDEEKKHYNYSYEDIQEKLLAILNNKDEKRIFLIDLALNDQERDVFTRSNDKFLAKTASKILENIAKNGNQENVLINTRLENIEKHMKSLISVSEKLLGRINIGYIGPNSFAYSCTTTMGRKNFYDAINGWLNDTDK